MKSAWVWFKGLTGVSIVLTIGGAILFAMAANKSTRAKRTAKKSQAVVEQLQYDNTKKALNKAAAHQVKADKANQKAKDADVLMNERLDRLGETNESIDDIADRFNSKRLRNG